MRIKLFVKDSCPRCPAAKHAVSEFDVVDVYNIDDIDGLAEASYHSVLSTPSILVVDSAGNELGAWRGDVPDPAQLRQLMAQ
ncbi:MAG: thioredoxin family protein [Coriobacteriia bacterium]|nr:thioredoxin family protein [Coriobacteriia bacterium]